jgi:hypothetical protein
MMGGPKFKGQWYARPRGPGLSAQNIIPERGKYTAYKWTSKQQDNISVYGITDLWEYAQYSRYTEGFYRK